MNKINKESFTLVEIVITFSLIFIVLYGTISFVTFYIQQVNATIERSNMYSQISYAFEDMKLRFPGAIQIDNPFSSPGVGLTATKDSIEFEAEEDIFDITPTNRSGVVIPGGNDNVWYRYWIDEEKGDLILSSSNSPADLTPPVSYPNREVLVGGQFSPSIEFVYTEGDEPNFITVKIYAKSAKEPDISYSFEEGIRLWFIGAVQ